MASTLYALLVGIDRYRPPVRPLNGCVADIEAMRSFLESRVPGDGQALELVTLLDEEASREAIIERFRTHLGRAGAEDTALFCFCGHGSQAPTAPELRRLEPDGLDETLVCHDSRRGGVFDLADKELSALIRELAEADPHIVLILDSCHSGSATRGVEESGVRRVETDTRVRPLDAYLAAAGAPSAPTSSEVSPAGGTRASSGTRGGTSDGTSGGTSDGTNVGANVGASGASAPGWAQLPPGRHVVLSACQADEEAKEIAFDGQTRGVFSHHLLEALSGAGEQSTYRDLFVRVGARVRTSVARQSPRIEANDPADLDRPFFGGAVRARAPYVGVYREGEKGWFADAGSIHGIAAPAGEETTHLSLFAATDDPFATGAVALGTAAVRAVEPGRSRVTVTLADDASPPPDANYKGVITSLPLPPLGVRLHGDERALAPVRARLARAGRDGAPPPLVTEVDAHETMVLIAEPDAFRIRRAGDDRPLSAVIGREASTGDGADEAAVAALEHVARWTRLLELANPASALPDDAVALEVHLVGADGERTLFDPMREGADLRLHYAFHGGEWHPPSFHLRLVNRSERRLHCVLFDLTERFRVSARGFFAGGVTVLEPGQSVWARDGGPVPVEVPDALWRSGMSEYRDVLKVIVSSEPFDASRFEQGDLGMSYRAEERRAVGPGNTLEKLAARGRSRDIPDLPAAGDTLVDWRTAELAVTTVRPLESRLLPTDPDESIVLGTRARLAGHATFGARARLSTTPQASRDLEGAPPLPTWLRDDPARVQPLDLSNGRDAAAGLSVLELSDVHEPGSVTPAAPLTMTLDAPLAIGEHALAIVWDEQRELYLPVGFGRREGAGTVIRIERLPEPSINTRSLFGSIKIFFRKIVAKALGREFAYPLLAAVSADGTRTTLTEEIRARVAAADRVVLYVHGIIGDTESMAASAFTAIAGQSVPPLGERHDLVLAFDYENLNTPIEENARLLGRRLASVGLGAGHGKTLHVVAHSMGGLVSRRFVEREGGHAVVSHLVMLGTPNRGSPWSTIENWLAGAIGIGLNRLGAVVWPVKVLGSLMGAFEKAAGRSLDQMGAGSDFLADLDKSEDPGVPYTIVAGNTSLIGRALERTEAAPRSPIERLLDGLDLKSGLHRGASLAFFGAPNDIAVSVEAIAGVPDFARLRPVAHVACDHMSYFAVDASLAALDDALSAPDAAPTPVTDPGTGERGLPA